MIPIIKAASTDELLEEINYRKTETEKLDKRIDEFSGGYYHSYTCTGTADNIAINDIINKHHGPDLKLIVSGVVGLSPSSDQIFKWECQEDKHIHVDFTDASFVWNVDSGVDLLSLVSDGDITINGLVLTSKHGTMVSCRGKGDVNISNSVLGCSSDKPCILSECRVLRISNSSVLSKGIVIKTGSTMYMSNCHISSGTVAIISTAYTFVTNCRITGTSYAIDTIQNCYVKNSMCVSIGELLNAAGGSITFDNCVLSGDGVGSTTSSILNISNTKIVISKIDIKGNANISNCHIMSTLTIRGGKVVISGCYMYGNVGAVVIIENDSSVILKECYIIQYSDECITCSGTEEIIIRNCCVVSNHYDVIKATDKCTGKLLITSSYVTANHLTKSRDSVIGLAGGSSIQLYITNCWITTNVRGNCTVINSMSLGTLVISNSCILAGLGKVTDISGNKSVYISNCFIKGYMSNDVNGCGICAENSTLYVNNSMIDVYFHAVKLLGNSKLYMNACSCKTGTAAVDGGLIHTSNGCYVNITGCVMSAYAQYAITVYGMMNISSSFITTMAGSQLGAAICVPGGMSSDTILTVYGCCIRGYGRSSGHGIYCQGNKVALRVHGCIFDRKASSGYAQTHDIFISGTISMINIVGNIFTSPAIYMEGDITSVTSSGSMYMPANANVFSYAV